MPVRPKNGRYQQGEEQGEQRPLQPDRDKSKLAQSNRNKYQRDDGEPNDYAVADHEAAFRRRFRVLDRAVGSECATAQADECSENTADCACTPSPLAGVRLGQEETGKA